MNRVSRWIPSWALLVALLPSPDGWAGARARPGANTAARPTPPRSVVGGKDGGYRGPHLKATWTDRWRRTTGIRTLDGRSQTEGQFWSRQMKAGVIAPKQLRVMREYLRTGILPRGWNPAFHDHRAVALDWNGVDRY